MFIDACARPPTVPNGVTFVDVWVSFPGLPKHPVQRDDKRSFPQRTGGTGFLEKVSCALPSSGFDKTSLPVLLSYPGGSLSVVRRLRSDMAV